MLCSTVVVGGDGARPDVHFPAEVAVENTGEMADPSSRTDGAVLDLSMCSQLYAGSENATGTDAAVRADAHLVAEGAALQVRRADHDIAAGAHTL